MVHSILNRKAGNKSQYHNLVFQHLPAHLWILLKWCIKFYLFPCNSAGVVMKFMSSSFPSWEWHEEEMWICLMCFLVKYSGLQCSGWTSWVSARTQTITLGKLSRCPQVEFLFFCLVMWPASQGTADRAMTLLHIFLFRAGFVYEVLHAATFSLDFIILRLKLTSVISMLNRNYWSLCHTSRGRDFHSREIWSAKSSPASWGPF